MRRAVHWVAPSRAADDHPSPVVAEVGYLLASKAGPHVEARFLQSLANEEFHVEELKTSDYHRMAKLVEQYADLPLGTTDAAVLTVAERLSVPELATLDLRHFTVVRARHVKALALLP